jgi:hypothetical protein
MIELTLRKLQKYVRDYNYEITMEQAKNILEILDDYYGIFTSSEIEMTTDYVVNGKESIFADYFN